VPRRAPSGCRNRAVSSRHGYALTPRSKRGFPTKHPCRATRGESGTASRMSFVGWRAGRQMVRADRHAREEVDGGNRGASWLCADSLRRVAAEDLGLACREADRSQPAKSRVLSRMKSRAPTPLNSILGFANKLLEREDLTGQPTDNVAHI